MKKYSKLFNEHYENDRGIIMFDSGKKYTKKEVQILKTKTEEAKKAIHLVKGVFEESEVIS